MEPAKVFFRHLKIYPAVRFFMVNSVERVKAQQILRHHEMMQHEEREKS